MKFMNDFVKQFLAEMPSNIEFDKSKLSDHAYLTNLIFSPSRTCNNDQQFSLMLEMLIFMEKNNPFIGGIITNLCYRYNENKLERKFVLELLYNLKTKYDRLLDITIPINSRWLVSSTNTLGTTLLMEGEVDRAKLIFEAGLRKYAFASHTPLLNLNLCMVYFQYAMIKVSENRRNHAISLFERCYYLSVSSVNEIYSSRNEYVLSMKMDCDKLLELGSQALKAKCHLSNGKILTGSRVPVSVHQ